MMACVSGQILATCSFALDEVRDSVDPQSVHAHVQPVAHDLQDLFNHSGVVVVKVRLMREEAVPVVGLGDGIPVPVGLFGIGEDDASVAVLLVRVTPDIKVAFRRAGWRLASGLKPGMLVGGMIHHHLDHDLKPAIVRCLQEYLEILDGSVHWVNVEIIGDVIAVVLKRRREKGQQPETGDA